MPSNFINPSGRRKLHSNLVESLDNIMGYDKVGYKTYSDTLDDVANLILELKCEQIGLHHCWKDVTANYTYATFPPQFPAKTRQCENCGCIEVEVVKQREIRVWEKKSDIDGVRP